MEVDSITLPAKQARPRDAQGKFLPRVPDLTSSPETQPPPSPNVSCVSADSSASSDSSDSPAFTLPLSSTTMTAATITSTHGKPPVFSDGDITPLNTRQFEEACLGYFRSAKETIATNKQTGRILGCFASLEINNWISVHSDDLLAKTFPEFMSAFRAEFLETDWSEKADAKLRVFKQAGKPFKEWVNAFRHQVLILKGTPEELSEKEQRKLIMSLMDEHLRTRASKYKTEESFKTWLELVAAEDISIRADYAQFKRLERANTPKSSPAPKRAKGNNGSALQRDGRVAPPALTDEERTVLTEFGGCFKCRNYEANHIAKECPNGFPDGRDYEERTRTHALAWRKKTGDSSRRRSSNDKPSASSSSKDKSASSKPKAKGKKVAAVLNDSDVEFDRTNVAMAKMVDYESSSDSEDDDAPAGSDDVSAPISCSGMEWHCLLDSDFDAEPINIRSFLDGGSSLVLASEEFVKRSSLVKRPLKRPIAISLAIPNSSSTSSRKNVVLYRYFVEFSVKCVDNSWSSHNTKAVVVPKIVGDHDVLLGMPWLSKNRIVQDFEMKSAIVKGTSIDLMNPSTKRAFKSFPRMKRETRRQWKHVRRLHSDVLRELHAVLLQRARDGKLSGFDSSSLLPNVDVVGAVQARISELNEEVLMEEMTKRIMEEYKDVFGPPPAVKDMPDHEPCRVRLQDPTTILNCPNYSSPRRYQDAWKEILGDLEANGRIRPSSSPHASPAFLVPKSDPKALPRLVIDFRKLKQNVVPDNFPIPRVDDILSDCARGRFWFKFDMTNSFYQTRVHEDDIHLLAMRTPRGTFEWVVMPQGYRNSPATHQRRMSIALKDHIGRICHIYIDDTIGWSNDLGDHETRVRLVLDACRAHGLFLNAKKSVICATKISFLGHHISREGIRADTSKIEKILQWPVPTKISEVRAFLGLVRYLAAFLPDLAKFTMVLDPLTSNKLKRDFPPWTHKHQAAFDGIKKLVTSAECLTTIDHQNPGDNKIFVTTDASDLRSGAILSFGPTWETARPVAFDSKAFRNAELHYPVHDKEMFAVIRALRKWRSDLLGAPFFVYTDHRALEFFHCQKDLSPRQQRWMSYLSQFRAKIVYVKGEKNVAADALSRTEFVEDSHTAQERAHDLLGPEPDEEEEWASVCLVASESRNILGAARHLALGPSHPRVSAVAAVGSRMRTLQAAIDESFIDLIKAGYASDPFTAKLRRAKIQSFTEREGLLFIGERLVVPDVPKVRSHIFHLAHDALGHFGLRKSYGALRDSFYWPRMHLELEKMYLKSCEKCQRLKDRTSKVPGPLHPLPVPFAAAESIAMDFIGPLPEDDGYDCVFTITDRLGADIRLIPCHMTDTAERVAELFFQHWYCENGLPTSIISDRDTRFISRFWKTLHRMSGIRLNLSSSFHPESDGSSERTNKTVGQTLRLFVDRNHRGWAAALPRVRFSMMNTVNASTGLTPFQLRLGRSPRLVPPLVSTKAKLTATDIDARALIRLHQTLELQACDALLDSKISQAAEANKHRGDDPLFAVGDQVLLSTKYRLVDYKSRIRKRARKFFPRWDGPFTVIKVNHSTSTYTLEMPRHSKVFPTFHVSQIKRYFKNDDKMFPTRADLRPPGVTFDDGTVEHVLGEILDDHKIGHTMWYLVRWKGYGEADDEWLPEADLTGTLVLKRWKERSGRYSSPSTP